MLRWPRCFLRPTVPLSVYQLIAISNPIYQLATRRAMSSTSTGPFIVMDPFCLRSFAQSNSSSTYINSSADDFVQRVNAHYKQQCTSSGDGDDVLKAGYAPFCKHIFMPNHLTDLHSAYLPVTDDNRQHLQSVNKTNTLHELHCARPVLNADRSY